MKITKAPTRITVVTGGQAQAIRKQRYEAARARLSQRIQAAPISEEEILAEVQAFREGQ